MWQICLPWMLCECIEVLFPLTVRFLRSGCCLYDIPSLILLYKEISLVHLTPACVPQRKRIISGYVLSLAFLAHRSFAPPKQSLACESTLLRAVASASSLQVIVQIRF